MAPLLKVDDLTGGHSNQVGREHTIDGVSLTLEAGKTLAIVGESGCGKTTLAFGPLGLLGALDFTRGSATFDGQDLLGASARELRALLGARVGVIFQDPAPALNPSANVQALVTEGLRAHTPLRARQRTERALSVLARVGIANPESQLRRYPHQLSLGMKQRVMLAMAISLGPKLLVADSPTAYLDPTLEAQVLELLHNLVKEETMALLLLTPDLSVAAEIADEIAILQDGRMIECGASRTLLRAPEQAYTRALLAATQSLQDVASPPSELPPPLEMP